jgi:hypothetical protein
MKFWKYKEEWLSSEQALAMLEAPDLGAFMDAQDREYEHHLKCYEDFTVKTAARFTELAATVRLEQERQRNSKLADEAGQLRSERDELLRENAVLRRTVERLERKR